MAVGIGQRPPLGGGQDERRRRRPPHPAGRATAAAAAIRRASAAVVEQGRRGEEGRRVERLVLDEPGGPGLGEDPGVGELVAGGMRVRDDDHRQPERGDLGQGRGAGPADDEVGRREGQAHVVAEERERAIALAERLPAGPPGRPGPPRSRRRR